MHDVAGHGFAVVAMQARVALLVFDEQPDQARRSLEAIQTISVKSLTELRSMLGTFHLEGPSDTGGAPAPEADARPDAPDPVVGRRWAGGSRGAGRTGAGGRLVNLDAENVGVALCDYVDVVAYRVVQKSLTNMLRHSGPTTADVRIARQDDKLVQVVDR